MNINVTKPTGVICKTKGKYCAEDITVVPVLEEKSATPTQSAQEIVPSAGNCGISKLTVGAVQTETKGVAPSTLAQTVTPTSGKFLSQVDVAAIPSYYVIPTGTLQITENGAKDVTNYKEVNVNVESGASLNIAYGDTPPTDTTKLWIKDSEPTNIKFTPSFSSTETMNSLIATLPTAAYNIASAVVGTKIYLFGGVGSGYLSTINVFDTTTNAITTLSATLPKAAYGIASAVVGTKIYLFGGIGSGYLSTINVFDTTTNSITTLSATLPKAAYGIASAVVGTKIYLFGGVGSGGSSGYLSTINVFDTTTNAITTLSTTLPKAARYIASAAVGTKIYLFGGKSNDITLSTINVFDTTTNAITTLSATLPTEAQSIASAVVGTKIYLFGGAGSGYLSTINVFDTTTNSITTLSTTLPKAAYGIASAAVGTKIYLFGGTGSGNLSTINQFVVSVDLTSGNILVVTNTVDLFNLISTDIVSLEVGIANIYKGNTDNQAELCDAYLYDGTNWVNVNTGEIYST